MSSFSDRLKDLINYKQITLIDFASQAGINVQTLSNHIGGTGNPSINIVQAYKKVIPDLNYHWLLTGEGKMLLEKVDTDTTMPAEALMESVSIRKYKEIIRQLTSTINIILE